jgi:hypothetical protein
VDGSFQMLHYFIQGGSFIDSGQKKVEAAKKKKPKKKPYKICLESVFDAV